MDARSPPPSGNCTSVCVTIDARALLLLRRAERHHGEERWAVAAQAGVVLVAGRLVDLGLAPELGLDRVDAQAVRLHAAVAAALAHRLVDDDPHRRVRQLAAL